VSQTPASESGLDSPNVQNSSRSRDFSELITSHLRGQIRSNPHGPVARQFIRTDDELTVTAYELADPLGESERTPVKRLIRKYRDRALLLATDSCAAHCRYCFRRSFTDSGHGGISDNELSDASEYLRTHGEISEVLISGGDPLTLAVERLANVFDNLRRFRSDLVLRVCTRLPIVSPDSVRQFLPILHARPPIWMVLQINHPDELTTEVKACIESMVGAGLPLLSQTVLLRGVNDSTEVLALLFRNLIGMRVKPYQLFQADLVPGTAHFRLPLSRGVEIYESLRREVSTLALPVYAVDAPGGGGKIPLDIHSVEKCDDTHYVLRGLDGHTYRYPIETDV
jgi:lysine 2,3-aminomutase